MASGPRLTGRDSIPLGWPCEGQFRMLATVRLDLATERVLARLARSSGRTRSDVIREAILHLAKRSPAPANDESLYASVADLIGVARGGPPDLSVRSGEKLRSLLSERARSPRR